jgi:uncharacterized protein (TIGR04222 family)
LVEGQAVTDWLLHNVIADMYGPHFLMFYGAAIVAIAVAIYTSVRRLDWTKDLGLPPLSKKVDPYEIAYLRGGENEVTRVAVASLIERGLLRIIEKPQFFGKKIEIDLDRKPAAGEVSSLESRVLKWSGFPSAISKFFAPGGIPAVLREACALYHEELTEKHLLAPPEIKVLGAWLWAMGSTLLMTLGVYKFTVALANGHHNVAFLVVVGIFGLLVVAVTSFAHPRVSHLGSAYLEQLKLAYSGLQLELHPLDRPGLTRVTANDRGTRGGSRAAVASADCLLMVGIFGTAALANTPLADVNALFKRANSGTGGCGGGCGGGGCGGGGCGGGCGGCGGG